MTDPDTAQKPGSKKILVVVLVLLAITLAGAVRFAFRSELKRKWLDGPVEIQALDGSTKTIRADAAWAARLERLLHTSGEKQDLLDPEKALRKHDVKHIPSSGQKMLELARDLEHRFEVATPLEKKQFIDLLVEEVVVDPKTRSASLTLTTLGGEMRKAALESSTALLTGGSGGP